MTVGAVQFNPSTAKVSWNTSTSKVQLNDGTTGITPCSTCDDASVDTPAALQVTFDSVTNCECAFWLTDIKCGFANFQEIADYLNGTTFILYPTSPGSCVYQYAKPTGLGTAIYPGELPDLYTCVGVCDTLYYDFRIIVNIGTATLNAQYDWQGAGFPDVFAGALSPDAGYCVKESGISNTVSCIMVGGGTADIVEL